MLLTRMRLMPNCAQYLKMLKIKNAIVAAELFESYGTIHFVNMFSLVIRAILTGGTFVVDEFDASIHPMAKLKRSYCNLVDKVFGSSQCT